MSIPTPPTSLNPSFTGATPLESGNNLKRFQEAEQGVYGGPSFYGDNPGFNFGFRQPFVIVRPNDSDITKYIKRFDTRAFPIGSTAQDVIRIGKLLVSGKGIEFLATQTILQGQNAFNETALYNPLEVGLATIRPASLGLLPRPKRHIDISGGFLGILESVFGFGDNSSNSAPPGTAGTSALSTFEQGSGRGLLRARTAAKGKSNIDMKWNGTQSDPSSFLTNLMSSFAPALAPLPSVNSGVNRADEKTSDLMISDLKKDSMASRLNSKIPTNVRTPINTLKQNFDSSTVYKDKTNIPSTNTDSKLVEKLSDLGNDASKNIPPDGNSVSDINTKLQGTLQFINAEKVDGVFGSIKSYKDLSSLSSKGNFSPGSSPDGGFQSSMNGKEKTLEDKGFAGSRRADKLNSKGVESNQSSINSDQISFYFEDVVNGKFIPFRATIIGLNESISTEWQDIQYMGRADKIFVYRGFTRDLSFNFVVYANSISELRPMWERINYLIGLTKPSGYTDSTSSPSSTGGFIIPPFIKIRIGDMYKNQPAVIRTIGLTVPEDAGWETLSGEDYSYLGGAISVPNGKTAQYPNRIELSIGLALLEKVRAETKMLHFDDKDGGKGFGESILVGGSSTSDPASSTIPILNVNNLAGNIGRNASDNLGNVIGRVQNGLPGLPSQII